MQSTLTDTTLILTRNYKIPFTITFNSEDVGRKIELTSNNGEEYFEPTADITSATMLVLVVNSPITGIKFTGAIGDTIVVVA